jgi:O-antigen/teichoic acid export membrane protein
MSVVGHTPQFASLRRNFSWTFIGNLIQAACQWSIITVIARSSSAENVGMVALGLSICGPVFMLTDLQLRAVEATDVKDPERFINYLSLRFFTSCLGVLIVFLCIQISGYNSYVSSVIFLISLYRLFESLSDIVYGKLQSEERHDIGGKIMITRAVIGAAIFAVSFLTYHNLLASLTAWVISGGVLWVIVDVPSLMMRRYTIRPFGLLNIRSFLKTSSLEMTLPDIQVLKGLLFTSLPLGLVMLLISLRTNIPRYVIESSLGTAQLGIFAALAYVVTIGSRITNALGQAATPRLASLYATNNLSEFMRLVRKLLILSGALGIMAVLAVSFIGEYVLNILYTAEYAQFSSIFTTLVLASVIGFLSSLLGYSITAARIFSSQVYPTMGVCGIVTVASLILVPQFGLAGAGYAVCIGEAFGLLFFYLLFRRTITRKRNERILLVQETTLKQVV